MTQVELIEKVGQLRAHILEHVSAQTPFPQPRKTRLAIEGLADPIKDCENPDLHKDWEEAFVLFHCYQRLKPARIHGRLKQMEQRYLAEGHGARFAAFFEQVKETLHPLSVTPHGYNKTFGEATGSSLFGEFETALAPVLALGHPVILYAGALLGYIRDGRLIEHDDDIDFAVHLGEGTTEEMPAKWFQYKETLAKKGYITEASLADQGPIFKLENDLGIDIDLFPCWTEQGRFSVYPYSLNDVAEGDIFPLRPFRDGQIMIPQNPEALLKQSYGDTWRVPDPLFHFNWPQAYRRFSALRAQDYRIP